jgi:drug/metabolite transporter (DMT)-like permease
MPPARPPSDGVPARPESADLLLFGAALLWGLNYSIVKFGIGEIAPLAFPVFRYGIGGIILLAFVRIHEGSIGMKREDLPLLALIGILGVTLGQATFVYALANTNASNAALLAASIPIVTTTLAALVKIERLGRRHWVSVLVGLQGVVLIIAGSPASAGRGPTLMGDLLALVNAVIASASALPIRHLLVRYSAPRILAWQMVIGTAVLLPFAIPQLLAQHYASITPAGWGALCYCIIFSAIVTNWLYFRAIGRVGPSRAAVYQYLQTFLAVLLAVLLLGERITVAQLLGGAIVVAGIVLGRRGMPRPSPARNVGADPPA